MAAFSSTSFSTADFSESAFSFGVGVLVEVDTHDGEPARRKKYKEAQEKRRQDIESAFDAAFDLPETNSKAKEIVSKYVPESTEPTAKAVKGQDFDLERFALNQTHLDWVMKVLNDKQDEENMLMVYLSTRR